MSKARFMRIDNPEAVFGEIPECRGALRHEVIGPNISTRIDLSCGDCDEAFDFCSLCCFCVWWSERADACLAAIAGTYASADMAWDGARSPACCGAGGRYDVGERVAGCRETGGFRDQRDAAYGREARLSEPIFR